MQHNRIARVRAHCCAHTHTHVMHTHTLPCPYIACEQVHTHMPCHLQNTEHALQLSPIHLPLTLSPSPPDEQASALWRPGPAPSNQQQLQVDGRPGAHACEVPQQSRLWLPVQGLATAWCVVVLPGMHVCNQLKRWLFLKEPSVH